MNAIVEQIVKKRLRMDMDYGGGGAPGRLRRLFSWGRRLKIVPGLPR